MKLLFVRKPSLSSWLIRCFTWSQWSHVAIVDGDDVIESTFKAGGVSRRPVQEFVNDYSHVEEVEWLLPNEAAAIRFARAQLGKPYDWTAILGFVLRRNWAEADAWFCNELAEAAAVAGGRKRFRHDLNRITPGVSWHVL